MRILSALLLPFLLSVQPASAQEGAPAAALEAFVTVRIDGLDANTWATAEKRIAKETATNVEYVCLHAGVLVLRMRDLRVTEKADIMALVKRLLHEGGVKGGIDFLDVHVERQGPDRC
ncbi:MAG: hypothetical protein KA791_07590 [Flavobacteriales bacterium]|nr:hypothetical protein [Flavobacteriales bacterium]